MKRSNRRKPLLRKEDRVNCIFFMTDLANMFFSCIIQKKKMVFEGRIAPINHPVDKEAQNGSSGNYREERVYVKMKF